MTTHRRRTTLLLAVAMLVLAVPAGAFEPGAAFTKGALVLSGEGSYGWQFNLEDKTRWSGLEFWDAGVRLGWLPFEPVGKDRFFHGALELGLEPLYQKYVEPHSAFWAGLAAVGRYHFLGLGRVVPYVELAGAAGGTDLKVKEIDSNFAFLVFGGAGMSVFVADRAAVYAGYRYQHVSNGNTRQPNRGFESSVGVAGLSFFFP